MQVPTNGAQRASGHRSTRFAVMVAVAMAMAFGSLVVHPVPASAASVKVVIVVGPTGSATSGYISSARRYAAQARAYGASVTEIYSPNATWTRVRTLSKGANVFIYLGHGNGYPSPYGAFSRYSKDGLGLNATAGHGSSNTKYYGEYYVRTGLDLARNSVVILNRLCYASGNSEWGSANPSKATAMLRVDHFATGFLAAGAKAVFVNGIDSITPIFRDLLRTNRTVSQIFQYDPAWTGTRDFRFTSRITKGATVWMDPYAPSRYYHSVVGSLSMTASTVRAGD